MTADEKAEWQKRKDAEDAGYDPKPWEGVIVHSDPKNNPARRKHEFVKWCLAMLLDEKGRKWATETTMDDGRVDVFDFGPTDGKAVVYEVETSYSEKRTREKIDQYCKGPVRDVLVIDPADVPDNYAEAIEYLDERVVL